MRKIFKYRLHTQPDGQPQIRQTLGMPHGAEILCVQMQGTEPRLWALVDPEAPWKPRLIEVYGTGHEMPDNPGRYLGTFQLPDGAGKFHAFHVFDNTPEVAP